MKVHWTRSASGHLDAIHDHIAQDSPVYAKRVVDRLTQRSKQIAAFLIRSTYWRSFTARETL